jgi:hypothetical protein
MLEGYQLMFKGYFCPRLLNLEYKIIGYITYIYITYIYIFASFLPYNLPHPLHWCDLDIHPLLCESAQYLPVHIFHFHPHNLRVSL